MKPPKPPTIVANDAPGPRKLHIDLFAHMRIMSGWWEDARDRLEWMPIDTYQKTGDALALAEPVILRSAFQWVYGAWFEGRWVKVTEGGSWPLDFFEPVQWAEPTLDDVVILGED